jgi:FRG domain
VNPLEQQFIGQVETPEGKQGLMLCIDSDRPHEFMLQWWNEAANTSAGCLCKAEIIGSGVSSSVKLMPWTLYRTAPQVGLYAPPAKDMNEEEILWIREVQAELRRTTIGYQGSWVGPRGARGAITLNSIQARTPIVARQCATWLEFKEWAYEMRSRRGNGEWFRGHGSSDFQRQTTLHRLGRYRLERYVTSELIDFNGQAEATLNRRLSLRDGNDYSTVLGLGRHHGVPTPLIDWTASPYIAAFFAFSDAIENRSSRSADSKVRIYSLSTEFVSQLAPPSIVVPWPRPYVAALTVGPLHNPRLNAQQGRFLVTNVGDVEAFIALAEARAGNQHLFAADVPASAAPEALRDLDFMGLTAATMFPGLDGIGRKAKLDMLISQPNPR